MMRPGQILSSLSLWLRGDAASAHVKEMKQLWNRLGRSSRLGYIAHLLPGSEWNEEEFRLVGERFVERMMDRYTDFGSVDTRNATILEIGCGVGRFSRPLASRFKRVIGYDISDEMVSQASERCRDLDNVEFVVNDGTSLAGQADASVDYCLCAGVFQHITHSEVIVQYVREALRVLVPGGLFLFQFEANRTASIGRDQRGARITAKLLDEALADETFEIRECSLDPSDPVRNMVIVLEKTDERDESLARLRFSSVQVVERGWIRGIYDGISTRTTMHRRLEQAAAPMTFFDD